MIKEGIRLSTTFATTDGYSIFVPAIPGITTNALPVMPERRGSCYVTCGDDDLGFPMLISLVVN